MAFRAAFRSSSEIVFLQSPSFSFPLLIRSGSGFSSGMIAFLVIPGCCAIFALESLHLKRRPMARDEGTYSAGLYTLRQPAFCRCLRHVPLSNALLLLYSGRLLVASGSGSGHSSLSSRRRRWQRRCRRQWQQRWQQQRGLGLAVKLPQDGADPQIQRPSGGADDVDADLGSGRSEGYERRPRQLLHSPATPE